MSQFWEWLLHMGNEGNLKMPLENLEEITNGTDDLAVWLRNSERTASLCLDEPTDLGRVQHCLNVGYAPDLDDAEIEKVARDPFLIAAALAAPHDRTVVTTEVSKPTRTRANRHLPDVCNSLGVLCCDSFAMLRALNFSTGWKANV